MYDNKRIRKYGYDILINNFEPMIRDFLINKIFLPIYGLENWRENIPNGVIKLMIEEGKENNDNNIEVFFDELYLWCLKEIIIQQKIYTLTEDFFGKDLEKEKFISIMDEINEHRRKIAHAKSNYTKYDFEILLELIITLCKGKESIKLIEYIQRDSYKCDFEIPNFINGMNKCTNNLPVEDYDLDGGFVGRRSEIQKIKKYLYTSQDRIISITGAGGLGKTALALKTAYSILSENINPYSSIVWFSAKENQLTSDNGIVTIESGISDYFTILQDILKVLNNEKYLLFKENILNEIQYRDAIYKIFETNRILLIIDNLETISKEEIIDFIKDVPRPSQVLITSRRGLGEIERRYPLPDFLLSDAVTLFRIISKERNRQDLQKLQKKTIENYVKSVSSYPLLIKWSIGKVCLGMDINKAFNEIYKGDSEISQFVFNDIFNLLHKSSKKCLYSMVIFGNKGISRHLIHHLTSLSPETVDDSLKELIITSFIYQDVKEEKGTTNTYYQMLLLTRGFIQNKLDSEKVLRLEIETKYKELSFQIENAEKSQSEFHHTLSMFGIETEEDKIAFNHIKIAKNYLKVRDEKQAITSFDSALTISPNFAYAYVEYGRFEYTRGHKEKAEKYYLKACHLDDNNYRNHFAYGVFLRRENRIDDAIKHLKKVELLNPEFPSLYNELGRTLSFKGEYEEANEKFKISLNLESQYVNYKHINISLYYQSDNYKRWAEKFFDARDIPNGKKILLKSLETIKKANANPNISYDIKNQILEKKIQKEAGDILLKTHNFELGKEYLLEASKYIPIEKDRKEETKRIAVYCFLTLARYMHTKSKGKKEEILEYIQEAESLNIDEKLKYEINSLKRTVLEKDLKKGIVEFFNIEKGFGVIICDVENKYTFLRKNIKSFFEEKDLYMLEEKKVSFKESLQPDGKKFAYSITFLN